MKSLGERLVAGLKNWRLRKKGAAPDETLDVGRVASESLEQPYNTQPKKKLSINITTTNPEEADTNTSGQIEPENRPETITPIREPQAPEDPTVQVGSPSEGKGANETPTAVSAAKTLQKRSATKKPRVKATDEPMADNQDVVPEAEVVLLSETHKVERTTDVSPKQPDEGLRQEILSTAVIADGVDQENDTASTNVEPINPPEALALREEQQTPKKPIPLAKRTAKKRKAAAVEIVTTATPALKPEQKRSRSRKPKSEDRPVTDKELADLEAENVRLKRLLDEKLKANRNTSEN